MNNPLKIDTDSRLVVSLAMNYGFILTFPAFGPFLQAVVPTETGHFLSSVFLVSLGMSFLLMPRWIRAVYHPAFRLLNILTVILVVSFAWVPPMAQTLTLVFTGIVTGRLTILWSHQLLTADASSTYGKLFLNVLFISYSSLYITNAVTALFPEQLLMLLSATFLAGTVYYSESFFDSSLPVYRKPVALPLKYLIPVFLIYLTAGITYTGVYPAIDRFHFINQYYNVLPFLVALPIGYFLMKKAGQKTLLLTGMTLLGIAFLLFIYPLGVLNFLFIQTALQAGWAFVDLFVWIYAAHLSRIYNYPFYLNYVVGTFLVGTGIGSFLFAQLALTDLSDMVFIALLLLLVSYLFVSRIPNNLREEMELSETGLFENLTNRERQIAFMLMDNMSGNEIAEDLNISLNTLKKHASKIYHKLDVKNKTDLISTYKKEK